MTETVDFQFVEGIAFVLHGERMQLAFHRNLVFFDSRNRDVMSIEYADITAVDVLTETIEKKIRYRSRSCRRSAARTRWCRSRWY